MTNAPTTDKPPPRSLDQLRRAYGDDAFAAMKEEVEADETVRATVPVIDYRLRERYGERLSRGEREAAKGRTAPTARKATCDACGRPGVWLNEMKERDGCGVCQRCYDILGPVSFSSPPPTTVTVSARLVQAHEASLASAVATEVQP